MNFQSLWLNEQWQNSTQQKCYGAITPKNQSMWPHKWWTTTRTTMKKRKFGRICFQLQILVYWKGSRKCILKSKSKCRKYHRNRLINWWMCLCMRVYAFISMISIKCEQWIFKWTRYGMTCEIANNQSRFNMPTQPNFHTTDLFFSSLSLAHPGSL